MVITPKICPICEAGSLVPQVIQYETSVYGKVVMMDLHHHECDACGSEIGTDEDCGINKQLMAEARHKRLLELHHIIAIRDAIIEFLDPDRIIIFGSYAIDKATEGSDIDIAVIVGDDQPTDIDTVARARLAVRKAIKGTSFDIDLIVNKKSGFDRRKGEKGSLQYEIDRFGQVIYERA